MSKTQTTMRTRQPRGAFTLVEILVVIAIMALLMALVVGVTKEVITKAACQQTAMTMGVINNRIKAYQMQYGEYPPSGTLATVIPLLNKLNGPPIESIVAKQFVSGGSICDSWGNPIQYLTAGTRYAENNNSPVLQSYGPDGVDNSGNGDDICVPERPK
ncbi:MAG: prepilin-type N-terminal cleavage/methylation domain-containing protein [Phycisphaerae bacterium]|nr:prepilin-type N-terminal cleavage/methylation domain-containing protein [Phycisphaerae bacterium]